MKKNWQEPNNDRKNSLKKEFLKEYVISSVSLCKISISITYINFEIGLILNLARYKKTKIKRMSILLKKN